MTPIPEETAPTPWVAPRFVGVDGQISSAGGTTACETITWTLTDVEMISAGCDGPVETLSFKRLEVSATLLPPGRDWASGGASLCL